MSVDLPGAVLAEEGVDLARADVEVDAVVRHQVAEALGDAAELEQRCVGHFVDHGEPEGRESRPSGSWITEPCPAG